MTDTNTPTPDNITPITPEIPASDIHPESLEAISQETGIPVNEIDGAGGEEDPVQAVIKGVDLNTLTKDDVFTDIIHQSKLFAFRLMVGAALLEQLIVKNHKEEEEAAAAGKAE
jgi:hypothetical protein